MGATGDFYNELGNHGLEHYVFFKDDDELIIASVPGYEYQEGRSVWRDCWVSHLGKIESTAYRMTYLRSLEAVSIARARKLDPELVNTLDERSRRSGI